MTYGPYWFVSIEDLVYDRVFGFHVVILFRDSKHQSINHCDGSPGAPENFTLLYRMFLNTERGPRIGNYFLDLGIDRATAMLQRYLH
jgi:lysyl-tRNA synthetase class I